MEWISLLICIFISFSTIRQVSRYSILFTCISIGIHQYLPTFMINHLHFWIFTYIDWYIKENILEYWSILREIIATWKRTLFLVVKMNIYLIIFICALPTILSTRTFRINNQCDQNIWFGIYGKPLIYQGGKSGFFWIWISKNPKKSQEIPKNPKRSGNPKSKVVFSNILRSYFQVLRT